MQNTVLTILGASVIVASTVQLAAAAERHTHKMDRARATASQQFRLSDYREGPVISAPAGR